MGGNLVLVVPDLSDIRHLGVVGLAQEPGKARGVEKGVVAPVHGRHAETKRLVAHRGAQFREGL